MAKNNELSHSEIRESRDIDRDIEALKDNVEKIYEDTINHLERMVEESYDDIKTRHRLDKVSCQRNKRD